MILFLFASPMFFTQSMMAQLDMPAMTFTALALLLFLDGHLIACAAACTALVLMQGNRDLHAAGVRRVAVVSRPEAARDVLFPGARHCARHLADGAASCDRTLARQCGVRAVQRFRIAPARPHLRIHRTPHLFSVHRRRPVDWRHRAVRGWRYLRGKEWTLAFIVAGAQLLLVSVLGGASLDRYALPAFPVLYAAIAAAGSVYPATWRWVTQTAMAVALADRSVVESAVSVFSSKTIWP